MTARRISPRKRSSTGPGFRKMARGGCLCGEVAFELVRGAGREMDCHCPRCRRAHSSVHASNIFVDARKFRWLRGEEQVSNYGPPQDWHFASAFCRSCGSTLPRVVRSVGIVVVPSGTLDGDPGMRPTGFGFAERSESGQPERDRNAVEEIPRNPNEATWGSGGNPANRQWRDAGPAG